MIDLRALFRSHFGTEPAVIASAPGRVNVIGEHIDYNGGEVLPIAIDRRTYLAVVPASSGERSRLVSTSQPKSGEFDARAPSRTGEWWDYVAGVCAGLVGAGAKVPQFDALIVSDVPAGAGLSSSAALEVASALALTTLAGHSTTAKDLALGCWRAETEFVGVNSGVMDQFASALCEKSSALHLWCDSLATESVPLSESVLIFDTATPRSLRGSAYNTRRSECDEALSLLRREYPELGYLAHATPDQIRAARLPALLERRALHVAEENVRVQKVVMALRSTGRIPGALLYESHESLRYLYECSTPELDWFVDRMRTSDGIQGARLTGAGWGGCAIAVGNYGDLAAVSESVVADYRQRFGLTPRVWFTSASTGARVELGSEREDSATETEECRG